MNMKKNWKPDWKNEKNKWIILIASGIILMILALPMGSKKKEFCFDHTSQDRNENTAGQGSQEAVSDDSYEKQLENRVVQILKKVDGVGKTDVMIVLRSSEEKVIRTDKKSSSTISEQAGQKTMELEEKTVLQERGNEEGQPIIEKRLRPEVAGIVISADGGDKASVKNEISEAMEALFDIPAHKIKVLKRVEEK